MFGARTMVCSPGVSDRAPPAPPAALSWGRCLRTAGRRRCHSHEGSGFTRQRRCLTVETVLLLRHSVILALKQPGWV